MNDAQEERRVSISVINGYLCTTCTEAAKARSGQNPHAPSPTNPTPSATSNPAQTPAVVFGGALTGQNAVAPVGAAQSGGASGSSPAGIDIQA